MGFVQYAPVGVRPRLYIQANPMAINNSMIRPDRLRLKMQAWLVHQWWSVLITSYSIHIRCSILTSCSVQDRSLVSSGVLDFVRGTLVLKHKTQVYKWIVCMGTNTQGNIIWKCSYLIAKYNAKKGNQVLTIVASMHLSQWYLLMC